jgi:hypothetical protein
MGVLATGIIMVGLGAIVITVGNLTGLIEFKWE